MDCANPFSFHSFTSKSWGRSLRCWKKPFVSFSPFFPSFLQIITSNKAGIRHYRVREKRNTYESILQIARADIEGKKNNSAQHTVEGNCNFMPRDFPSSSPSLSLLLPCQCHCHRRFITCAYSVSGLEMRRVQASEFCWPDTLQNITYKKGGLESQESKFHSKYFFKETVLTS